MHQKITKRLRKLLMEIAMVVIREKNVKSSRDIIIKMMLKNKKRRNPSMPKNIMTEIYLQKPSSLDESRSLQLQRPRLEIKTKYQLPCQRLSTNLMYSSQRKNLLNLYRIQKRRT